MRNIANKRKASKKRSEKDLKELTLKLKQRIDLSEEKYKTIFENTGTATIIVEEDTTISLVNGQFEELSGYSREEVEWQKRWAEFVVEEDLERMKGLHYSRRKDPKSTQNKYEFHFINKEGNIRDILIVIDLIPGTKKSVASLLDISERKKTEEIIKKEIEKSKNYLNIAGVVIVALDTEGNITLLNRKGHKILQYNEGELLGKNWFKTCLPKRYRQNTQETFNKLIHSQLELTKFNENPILAKNGDERMIAWHNSLLFDSNGIIIGTLSSGEDITERKKAEEKLKDSKEKYRYLFANAQVGLYWSRISDGNFLECNETFAKLFGYDTREEFLANYNAIEHYTNPNARSELLEEILNNKEIKNYEIHVTRNDGTPIWLSISARVFEKEDRIEGAAIDITERKQAERELQLERDNFLNILNSMVDGVYIVDQNYDIEYVNPILIKEFGQFDGTKCFSYFEDRNEPCPRCKNKEVFQGKTVRGEWISPKNQKTYDIIDTPMKNLDGSISKLGIFRDISESKKAEQVLKESEEKYREAYNRAEFYKDLFAHDINNILQSILSGIQISQLIVDNPEKRDNLKENAAIIKEQVIRGAKLVSNVQKLSKLEETGKILEKIEILNVLKNTISFVEKSYNDKKLAIRVDSLGEKLIIKANALLEDVFENLLINAIRHNTNLITEITVRISRERNVGKGFLKMEFMDNGIGVGDSMKEKIFQRGNNKDKGVYGMGLGLSLVRGIIESYNGKVWVEDRVKGDRSRGSNFVLVIPEVD